MCDVLWEVFEPLEDNVYVWLGEATPGVFFPVLGSLVQKTKGHTEESLVQGHRDDLVLGAPLLWGKTERAGTVRLEKRRLRGNFSNVHKYLQGWYKDDRSRLFPVVSSDRTRGHGHKLKPRRIPLNVRKHFFTVRVTKHWHRFPRETVEFFSLEIFKSLVNVVLGRTRCSCLGRGVWQDDIQRSIPTSTILWFCEWFHNLYLCP